MEVSSALLGQTWILSQVKIKQTYFNTMSTRRTRTYTTRADAADSGNQARKERLRTLKALGRSLTPEELAELQRLIANG